MRIADARKVLLIAMQSGDERTIEQAQKALRDAVKLALRLKARKLALE